jgi:DivIVA domain-containing protein
MAVAPQEISQREFFSSKNGYDKEEVKAFLEVIAKNQAALLARIDELTKDADDPAAVGKNISALLSAADAAATQLTRKAEMKAAETRRRVEEEAAMLRTATEEATDRLRAEAEQYAYEIRVAAERSAREQQMQAAERVGRLLTGESTLRERLYTLEVSLQSMRGDLKEAAESLYPQLANVPPPLPQKSTQRGGLSQEASVIDLRESDSMSNSNGSPNSKGS